MAYHILFTVAVVAMVAGVYVSYMAFKDRRVKRGL